MTHHLNLIDWIVVAAYFVVMLWIGLAVHKKSGSNMRTFFTGGGNVSWVLVSASLVATSFGADTPLWVTGLIRNFGIQAVWQFWAYFLGAGLAVFLFSRMWRRSGILTDVELLELRYSGSGAALIRGFNASWYSLVINIIVIGWATKGMQTILVESLGLSNQQSGYILALIVVVTLIYCAASGLFGVIVTDVIQLVLALIGTLSLAAIAVDKVGGPSALVSQLHHLDSWSGNTLEIGPKLGSFSHSLPGALSPWNFMAFVGVAWIGLGCCSGYICQRMLACRSQKEASKAMFGYTLFYWGFLAWPWIVVALCSLILLTPEQMAGKNAEAAYPMMAMTYLPQGLRGMLFVALAAAYMSTMSTLVNYGASYAVNDVYRRFLNKHASDSHYVWISRLTTATMAVVGALVAWSSDSIIQLLQLHGIFALGGVLIPLLRWFWWRTTPWGELAAFLTSVIVAILIVPMKSADPLVAQWLPMTGPDGAVLPFSSDWNYFGMRIFAVMIPSTLAAIFVSLLTHPSTDEKLAIFITKLNPPHFAWAGTAKRLGINYTPGEKCSWVALGWLSTTLAIAGLLYGLGWIILGQTIPGLLALCLFLVFLVVSLRLSKDT